MVEVKRIKPGDVIKLWDRIKEAIKISHPPTMDDSEEACDDVLSNLVQGKMQLWAMFEKVENEMKPKAIAVTEITGEPGYKYKTLLIYALVSAGNVSDIEWGIGYNVIREFAKSNGCKKIIGYTNLQRIVDIVQKMGGKAEYVVVTMEV